MNKFTKVFLDKEVTLVDGRQGKVVEIIDRHGGLARIDIGGENYVAEFAEVVRTPKSTWKHGRNYYKNDYSAPSSPEEFVARLSNAMHAGVVHQFHYENPFALQYLYYVEGMSLKEMANEFGCHSKTVSRWMNYYGLNRRNNAAAQFVAEHGVEHAYAFNKMRYNGCYGSEYE